MNIMNRFTLRTLKKNKVRTLVTILGIVLATAMFTAVSTIIVSLQNYLVNYEIEQRGAWQGEVEELTAEQVKELLKDDRIDKSTVTSQVGYAVVEDCWNESKPYMYIQSIDNSYTDMAPVKLTEGRMAENSNELVIAEHIISNGGATYKVGDEITLDVGIRTYDGQDIGGQYYDYQAGVGKGDGETLSNCESQTYTIVGICERPDLELYSASGYTAYTYKSNKAVNYDVLFTAKDASDVQDIIGDFTDKMTVKDENYISIDAMHSDLLRFMGKSTSRTFNGILYSMGAILIAIIMVASISLIYNAFSISISERTVQFGLLKSIGATRKQMRRSVIFEAMSLCIVGIPVGVISGLIGIGITLHFVGRFFSEFISEGNSVAMTMEVSWKAILVAVVVAIVTVVISAMIPAARAVRMTAIQAIRQSNDTKLGKKNVRTSKLVYKIWGFEGMLANKNFKRNRKKQRITVLSLTISVVLFITANSFSAYTRKSLEIVEDNTTYDISCDVSDDDLNKNTIESTESGIDNLTAVDECSYSKVQRVLVKVPFNQLNQDYINQISGNLSNRIDQNGKQAVLDASVYYVQDKYYEKYLEANGLDVSQYMDTENICPLVWDEFTYADTDGGYKTINITNGELAGQIYYMKDMEDSKDACFSDVADASDMTLSYEVATDDDSTEIKIFTASDTCEVASIDKASIYNGELPMCVEKSNWNNNITMVLPYSALAKLPNDVNNILYTKYYINAEEHEKATEQIEKYLSNGSFGSTASGDIYDASASTDADNALIMIVNIFSYGFITLISLIVVANVFNTISTNIQLRRKEFAMLKSVGMTQKRFDKMMNYECLLYGIKGLIYGMPISVAMTYLMYKSVASGWNISFFVPWISILVVVVSVFLVVFASMLYSMRKIKKDNPIEALRNDNL